MEQLNLEIYIDMIKRRFYWIIMPFFLVMLIGLIYVLVTEPIFEARTLILVQPQEVPANVVAPIIQKDISERLRTITQQVTSRTNLEAIISDFELYNDPKMLMEEKVKECREDIMVNVGGKGSTFEIAFRHKDPEKAKDVANSLASNFISENLKIRESQALGTSTFLTDELESINRKLEKKDEILAKYSEKYMGSMPENLATNLSMLRSAQAQLEQLNSSLQNAQNRKLMIQEQIANQKRMAEQMSAFNPSESFVEFEDSGGEFESQEIIALKQTLAALQRRYTENHPDVRRIKAEIAELEAAEAAAAEQSAKAAEASTEEGQDLSEPAQEPEGEAGEALPGMGSFMPSPIDMFGPQLNQINFEIRNIQADIAKVKSRIAVYESRVEETPKREQELKSIQRDYDNLKNLYDSLLDRKLEAEISVSMEKKQKGEQFRILDPAKRPELPVEPNLKKIFLLTVALGLGLGGGLAYLIELMDHSYKFPKDAEADLGMPVLVSLPVRFTPQEVARARIKKWLMAACVFGGFTVAVVIIILSFKGLEGLGSLFEFTKNFIPI